MLICDKCRDQVTTHKMASYLYYHSLSCNLIDAVFAIARERNVRLEQPLDVTMLRECSDLPALLDAAFSKECELTSSVLAARKYLVIMPSIYESDFVDDNRRHEILLIPRIAEHHAYTRAHLVGVLYELVEVVGGVEAFNQRLAQHHTDEDVAQLKALITLV